MGRIKSRDDLKKYILRMLGHPQQEVELTDNQLDHCIDDARRIYQEFASVANQREFLTIHLEEGQSTYDVPPEVRAVLRPLFGRARGINTLFTVENALYMSGHYYFKHFDMVSYAIARQYIGLIDYILGSGVQVDYSQGENQITVRPTPATDGTLMLEVYATVESPEFYDQEFVVNYALAAAKYVWGMLGSKYDTTLPDGSQVTLDQLRSEARDEMQRLKEELRQTWEAPPMFFTG